MNRTIRSGWALVFGLFAVASVDAQTPLGTAFTYQGQLKSAGAPANGPHDLRFRLYDALVGGAQVGTTQCFNDVAVAAGLFTVALDFGAEFAGQERFLEIDVRADTGLDCTNSAGFVTLGPRQPLTAAPNALFALNADLLNGQSSSAFAPTIHNHAGEHIVTGTIADERLSSNVGLLKNKQAWTGVNTFSSPLNAFTGNGSGLTAVDADLLDGLDSSAFLQAVPNPLTLSGNRAGDGIIQGTNTASNSNSSGIYGLATAGAGATAGVRGQTDSVDAGASGVYGLAADSGGAAYGVFGLSVGDEGVGVRGDALASTGFTFGVVGHSTVSPSGRGVWGRGNLDGVLGQSLGTSGVGVFGVALADTGITYGVRGRSASPSGFGGYFENSSLGSEFYVELAGPNGAVNTRGFVYREYLTSDPKAAIPIAYGSVDAAGAILSGTMNFTVAHPVAGQYDVTVFGETYSNAGFTVTITPVSNSPRIANVADAGAGFRVNMWNLSGTLVDNAFQFTIWKSDPN